MENQEYNVDDLSLEQIEKLIVQTKLEIAELQKEVIDKNNYLLDLLRTNN